MNTDPADALEALRRRFIARAAEDLATLNDHAASGAAAREKIRFLIHRLAGAAGVFGYGELSDAAARLDAAFADGPEPGPAEIAAFTDYLSAFVGALEDR